MPADSGCKDQFEALKAEGNEHFKAKNYERAKSFYSKAIEVKSDEPVAYSNRAACNLNLKNYYHALADCNRALELDPNSCKVYYRRATAFRELSRLKSARADFIRVLDLDPTNKLARIEVDKVDRVLEQDSRVIMETFDKPEESRSTKPMQRFLLNNLYSGSKKYNLEVSNSVEIK